MESDAPQPSPEQLSAGLRKIRRRRCFLWFLVAAYLPSIWLSLRITRSDAMTLRVFLVWFALVLVAACLASFSKCPRCGNYFHISGFTPVWFRRCVHCELPLRADRNRPS